MDGNGNLFFVLLEPMALVCWDSTTAYNADNIKIVHRDDVSMQFSGGMKIVKNLNGEDELWFITNRLQVKFLEFKIKFILIILISQKFMTGTTNPLEVNYRIFVGVVRMLLNNQPKCNGQSLKSIQQVVFPNQ